MFYIEKLRELKNTKARSPSLEQALLGRSEAELSEEETSVVGLVGLGGRVVVPRTEGEG